MQILSLPSHCVIIVVDVQRSYFITLRFTYLAYSRQLYFLCILPVTTFPAQGASHRIDPHQDILLSAITIPGPSHHTNTYLLLRHRGPLRSQLSSILNSALICLTTQLFSPMPLPMLLISRSSLSYPNPQLSVPYSHLHIRTQPLRPLIAHRCPQLFRISMLTTTFSIWTLFPTQWTLLARSTLKWSTPSWRTVLDTLLHLIVQWWQLSPSAGPSTMSAPVGPCPWQCPESLPRVVWVRSSSLLENSSSSDSYSWKSPSHYLGATYTDRPWFIPQPGTDTRWNCFLYLGDDNPNSFLCGSLQKPGPCFVPAPLIYSYLQILQLIVQYISSLPPTVTEIYRCAFRLRLLRENLYHHYGHGSTTLLGAPALIGAPGYCSHKLGLSYALRDRRGGSSSNASDRLQRFPYPFRFQVFPQRTPLETPP